MVKEFETVAVTKLTVKEKLLPIIDILKFKPKTTLNQINAYGKQFLPVALVILFLFSLIPFISGLNLNSLLSFVKTFIDGFLHTFIIFFFGRWFFNGKASYWNLFNSLTYLTIIVLYLVPLFLIFVLIPPSMILFIILFVLYYIILSIVAINICHQIKSWQSFILLVISGVLLFLLEKGISVLFKLPTNNIVGQAMNFIL